MSEEKKVVTASKTMLKESEPKAGGSNEPNTSYAQSMATTSKQPKKVSFSEPAPPVKKTYIKIKKNPQSKKETSLHVTGMVLRPRPLPPLTIREQPSVRGPTPPTPPTPTTPPTSEDKKNEK